MKSKHFLAMAVVGGLSMAAVARHRLRIEQQHEAATGTVAASTASDVLGGQGLRQQQRT